jgi:hypothetical protein
MENLIDFFDLQVTQRGRNRMGDNEVSFWYNVTKPSNANYCVTFNSSLDITKKYVKFGNLGGKLAVMFTDDPKNAIKYRTCGKVNKNIVVDSKKLVEMVFKTFDKPKDRIVLTFNELTKDVFLINFNL